MPENQKPTIGRVVHYGIGLNHEGNVEYRPAVVVQDWGSGIHPNLQVLLDFSNDAHLGHHAKIAYDAFVAEHPGVNTGAPIGDEAVLQKFCDLSNAVSCAPTAEECARGSMWRTSVDEGTGVGQWRWPPRT